MRAKLASLFVAAMALAGCAGGGDPADDTSSSSATPSGTTTGSGTGGGSGGGGSVGNNAPKASIAASVAAGPVPLTVNFTLDGADADKDPLTWALDADADGKADLQQAAPAELPTRVTFEYTAAGLYNATLSVSDGKETVKVVAIVNVTAAAAGKASYSFSNTYTGVDPTANPTLDPLPGVYGCMAGSRNVGGNWNTDLPDMTGWSYAITPAGMGFNAYFYQADGTTRTGNGGDTGTVPAETSEADICTADPNAGGSYTFTATSP